MVTTFLRFLWILPFTVHAAYFTATVRFFPEKVGPSQGAAVSRAVFSTEWLVIVIISNVLLLVFWRLMPRLNDRMLGVPNREYWLKNSENRTELIQTLQNLLETILVLINIFFLGIYQWVYQSNVLTPVIRLPLMLLIAGFITFPLALIAVYMTGLIKNLKHPKSK